MSLLKPGAPNMTMKGKSNILQNIDSRIHHLSRNFDIKESSRALKETIVKQHLKDLH